MSGLNKVMLIGNLGADGELTTTSQGTHILKLRLATSERYTDKTGKKVDKVEWHSITLFGPRAQSIAQYMTRGTTLFVEGSLHTNCSEKDGVKRYFTGVVASNIEFVGGRRTDGESAGAPIKTAGQQAADDTDDAGLPF